MATEPEDRASRLGADFTVLLRQWQAGDAAAAEQVLLTTYQEMRRLASRYLRSESRDHTLQPTALVHELYLDLLASEPVTFSDRSHFLALCARQLRNLLVDHARRRGSQRRGGDVIKLSLQDWDSGSTPREEGLLDLDRALTILAEEDERSCKVVELRFFGGLNEDEIATVLNISLATVKRDWTFARAWLQARLNEK
jgi:RNA polymerase sigma-70 factor (ECF subfamily)